MWLKMSISRLVALISCQLAASATWTLHPGLSSQTGGGGELWESQCPFFSDWCGQQEHRLKVWQQGWGHCGFGQKLATST